MAFDFKQKLPTPQEIREMYPVPDHVAQIKKERDEEIRKIFTGESDRFIAIGEACHSCLAGIAGGREQESRHGQRAVPPFQGGGPD